MKSSVDCRLFEAPVFPPRPLACGRTRHVYLKDQGFRTSHGETKRTTLKPIGGEVRWLQRHLLVANGGVLVLILSRRWVRATRPKEFREWERTTVSQLASLLFLVGFPHIPTKRGYPQSKHRTCEARVHRRPFLSRAQFAVGSTRSICRVHLVT